MHRLRVVVAAIAVAVVLQACRPPTAPAPPEPGFVLVAVGDSITMGIQDAGLSHAFQRSNYPYLIAQQLGIALSFKQPYLKTDSPGIAAPPYKEPLKLQNGEITAELWPEGTTDAEIEDYLLLQIPASTLLARGGFHNLGVSGARLFDVRNTTHPDNSQDGDNVFFTLVLQNDESGTRTMLGQAKAQQPDVAILWIGSNDVLHVALDGAGVEGSRLVGDSSPTPVVDFATEYNALLADLAGAVENVLVATIPNYLPFAHALDGIFLTENLIGDFAGSVPVVFDPATFEPIDFGQEGTPLYLPLMLEESDVEHLLFTGAIALMDLLETGVWLGLPDDAALSSAPYDLSGDAELRARILSVYDGYGWTPSGLPLPGETTLTATEAAELRGFIDDYNAAIYAAADVHGVPVVDMGAAWWSEAAAAGQSAYTLKHAIQDPDKTAFSLDGVHPGNLGHALSANAFIVAMNANFGMAIPEVNVANHGPQYRGLTIGPQMLGALTEIRSQWR